MAEFQEVARHWKRMCKKYWTATSCHGCPIAEHEHGYEACSAYEADVVKMEELVILWAAEHPDPVYPTWAQWLEKMGLIEIRWNGPVLASMRIGVDDTNYIPIVKKMLEPIPADIAEKLGLQPKAGA